MKRTIGVKRETIEYIPQDLQGAAAAIAEISFLERSIAEKKNQAEEKIAQIQKEISEEVALLAKKQSAIIDGLHAFAESNRQTLTKGGKTKTVKLPTGSIAWRLSRASVHLSRTDEEILKDLRRRRLKRFIRTKEEINKTAMLSDPKAATRVPGVEISQREEFVIKPSDLDVNVVKDLSLDKSDPS